MKLFITTAMQEEGVATYKPVVTNLAKRDRFGEHCLIDDPEAADFILFLDGHQHYRDLELNAIRRHPLVVRHREKAFLYSEMDQPWCAMPGLYVAMPTASFDLQRQRACCYLTLPNSYVGPVEPAAENARILFSFMGRGGNCTRERIIRLVHPRAVIMDTSSADFFGSHTDAIEAHKRRYATVMADSKFILCPRGAGPSSFRIFETMAAGRIPVILSDAWVPPVGPDWRNCAIFVSERDVAKVPKILEREETRYPEMANQAYRAWKEWFAPDVLFHRMTESLKDIVQNRRTSEAVLCRRITSRYLRLKMRATKSKFRNAIRTRIHREPAVSHSRPLASNTGS